jgi:hypothetical protein
VGLATLGLTACATRPLDNPRAVLLDREAEPSRRERALRQIVAQDPAGADLTALHDVTWSDRQPTKLRLACMDALIAHDADAFWAAAARHIVTVDRLPVLWALCERAALTHRREMVGPLVRSWARPAGTLDDLNRPEAFALQDLRATDDLFSLLWSVLRDPAEGYALTEETAAWVVLNRLDADAVAGLEQDAEVGPDALLHDLRRCAAAGVTPPTHREGVLWLTWLMREADGAAWTRLARAAEQWDGSPLALRHLPVLAAASPARRRMSRGALVAAIDQALRGRPVHPRGLDAEREVYVPPLDERWSDHRAAIGQADALLLMMVIEALEEPTVVRALFAQAEADRVDTESEHGGALRWDESGRLIAQPFASTLTSHDRRFISSHALIEAMYTGLAHYHFHAQQHDNAPYAGPGGGDLKFAKRMGYACVVLTFVDAETLAADVYLPDGTVVDVGVLKRAGVAR